MTTKVEETGLETITEESLEIAPSKAAAREEAEIKSAIIVALKFPRNEDQAFESLMKSCQRSSFADDASYSFPRGGRPITGPSVHLAREAARVWGNIRHGVSVVSDDEKERTIEAFAWDLQTNAKVIHQDTFAKSIQRKQFDGNGTYLGTKWVTPNERDLRELSNKRAAILKRNCIFELLPRDFIEDALALCQVTLNGAAEKDPDGFRKRLIVLFSGLKIKTKMIEKKLGHKLSDSSPEELTELHKVYTSIKDGNSSWAEYADAENGKSNGKSQLDNLTQKEQLDGAAAKKAERERIEENKKKVAEIKAEGAAKLEKDLQEKKEKGEKDAKAAEGARKEKRKGLLSDGQLAKIEQAVAMQKGLSPSFLGQIYGNHGVETKEELKATDFKAVMEEIESHGKGK